MIGTVEGIEAGYAQVSIKRQEMCGDCHGCDLLGEVKPCVIKCNNSCDAQMGDLVEVDVAQNHFFRATWLMYGLPLVGLLMGLGLGAIIPVAKGQLVKELLMIVLGIAGTSGAWLWVRRRERQRKYEACLPHIIRTIH